MIGIMTLTFILILGILLFSLTKRKSHIIPGQFKRRTHLTISAVFISFLFITAAIAELMEPFRATEMDLVKVPASLEQERIDLEMNMMNGTNVDSTLILETRTHPVGDTLTIHRNHGEYEGPIVYVERKKSNDATVEEIIYKPFLMVSDYDFSDALTVAMPVWTDDSVTFQQNSLMEVTKVSYYDAPFLTRWTQHPVQGDDGYSSVSRSPVVQLIVPEHVEIITPSGDEDVFFIDELNG